MNYYEEIEIFEKAERERAIQYVNDWVSTIKETEHYKYKNYEIKTYVAVTPWGKALGCSEIEFTDIPLTLKTERKEVDWNLIPKEKSFLDILFG